MTRCAIRNVYRLAALLFVLLSQSLPAATNPGALEADVKSDYSHIRVRRHGQLRSMIFVRDRGEEVAETILNIKRPYELVSPYARVMFSSYFFVPKQEKALIVGLGGGAMVHFYEHYDAEVKVDAVEIDAKVVELAEKYFEVHSKGNTKIITDDAFRYFKSNETRYDVIYMDAFLKPSDKTDTTGQPLELKTVEFYKGLEKQLAPSGVVVINFNAHPGLAADLATMNKVFAQVYAFRCSAPNLIVVGSWDKTRMLPAAMREKAKELDRRFKTTFSFQGVANGLMVPSAIQGR